MHPGDWLSGGQQFSTGRRYCNRGWMPGWSRSMSGPSW